jgi:hypothetical protein
MTPVNDGPGYEFDLDEGWFTDPWGHHEARWFSLGKAADLVRDGGVEGHDPVPNTPPTLTPAPIPHEAPGRVGAEDLKRADDEERKIVDPDALRGRLVDAAEEGLIGGVYVPPHPAS